MTETKISGAKSNGVMLLAMFLPPLYFLLKGRWGAFLCTLLFFVFSIAFCLWIVAPQLIPVLWLFATTWSIMDKFNSEE